MVKFACDCCGRSYSVAEELRGRAFKMKCKLCGHLIVVKPEASSQPDSIGGEQAKAGGRPSTLFTIPEASSTAEATKQGAADLPFSGRGAGLGLGDWLPAPSAHSEPVPPPAPLLSGEPPPAGGYLDFNLEDRPGSVQGTAEAPEVTDSSILGVGETTAPEELGRNEKPSGLGDPFADWSPELGQSEPKPESKVPLLALREPEPEAEPEAEAEPAAPSVAEVPAPTNGPVKKAGRPAWLVVVAVSAMVAVAGLLYMLASRNSSDSTPSSSPTIILAPGASSRPQLGTPQLAAPDPQYMANDKGPGKQDEGGRTPSSSANRPNSTKVAQIIGTQRQSFDECTTQAASRNSSLEPGRKAVLIVTVVPTGDVTAARLDDPAIDDPQLAACLKRAAKRMAFPSFEGGPLLVEVPLTFSK